MVSRIGLNKSYRMPDMRLTGEQAIAYADDNGHFLSTADRDDVTIPEARRIAEVDPELVFIDTWED